jgi:hypothetical protein
MSHQVFISYASEDHEVAGLLCRALEGQGIGCWVAPRDITPGHVYAEAIIGAINTARVLVLAYSARTNSSPHVTREVERAVSKGVAVVTFKTDAAPLSPALEYFLSHSHWLEAFPGGLEEHLPRLTDAVVQLLRPATAASPAPVPGLRSDNPLHTIWDSLDPSLQDAFSLAYNKKRREGSTRISTRDFFQALACTHDEGLQRLLGAIPAEALPEPVAADVPVTRQVLEEAPLLSDCVAESLGQFRRQERLPRKLTPADVFVDIAKHGHGSSVRKLREHGIGPEEIEDRVRRLGLSVIRRREEQPAKGKK